MTRPSLDEILECAPGAVREAGGRGFTACQDRAIPRGGNGISTNAALHDALLQVIRGEPR